MFNFRYFCPHPLSGRIADRACAPVFMKSGGTQGLLITTQTFCLLSLCHPLPFLSGLLYVFETFAWWSITAPYVGSAFRSQERALDFPGLAYRLVVSAMWVQKTELLGLLQEQPVFIIVEPSPTQRETLPVEAIFLKEQASICSFQASIGGLLFRKVVFAQHIPIPTGFEDFVAQKCKCVEAFMFHLLRLTPKREVLRGWLSHEEHWLFFQRTWPELRPEKSLSWRFMYDLGCSELSQCSILSPHFCLWILSA